MFVFITRPVNISDFNSTHFCLSLGREFFFKLVTDHPVILMVCSIKKYLRDPEILCLMRHLVFCLLPLKVFLFVFLFSVGFTKEMTCNVLHVFISALDFVLNKSCSLLCLYLVVIFLVL